MSQNSRTNQATAKKHKLVALQELRDRYNSSYSITSPNCELLTSGKY